MRDEELGDFDLFDVFFCIFGFLFCMRIFVCPLFFGRRSSYNIYIYILYIYILKLQRPQARATAMFSSKEIVTHMFHAMPNQTHASQP